MSRKSDANPDHYKQAGRGRQGQDVVPKVEWQKFKEQAVSRFCWRTDPQRSRKRRNQPSAKEGIKKK
jgi:hypothetical protein